MKVAYLINQYPKISHTFVRNEILELERQGLEIARYSLRGWDIELADERDFAEREATTYLLKDGSAPLIKALLAIFFLHPLALIKALFLSIRSSRTSERPLPVHLIYLAEACLLHRMLTARGITQIHCHFGTNATEVGMLCAALGGISYSFTVHGPEEFDKSAQLNLAEKAHRARFVVAISSYGRSQLYRYLRTDDWDKIRVIHCGLGADFIDTEVSDPPAEPRLVSIGRLSEQKGQIVLLRACKLLADRGVHFTMELVGDGELRPQIEEEIKRDGLEGIVHLAGWKSSAEVREILASSRALVLPSFAEGLPVVIMEAMALGRPVISTYVAGIPELVRHGSEGYLVPASDPESLADAMEQFLAMDAEAPRAMGLSAKERARERHSITTEAGKLAALFRSSGDQGQQVAAPEIINPEGLAPSQPA